MGTPHIHLHALCQIFGIDLPDPKDMDPTIAISFSDQLVTCVSAEEEGLVVFAKLGAAPENSTTFLEELLSANLFWRDTQGATLSLDPETRGVFLAQRIPISTTDKTATLQEKIERFAQTQAAWTSVLESMNEEDMDASPMPMNNPDTRWA